MKPVAIIPARGGSKRIPKKNIRHFNGTPLLGRAVTVGLDSGLFESVVVSTDDPKIAEIATFYGADVPCLRPADLSGDFVGTVAVVADMVGALECSGDQAVCCLYATTPLLNPHDLVMSYEKFRASSSDYCIAATSFDFPVQRAFEVISGKCCLANPEFEFTRSQDLTELFHDAGAFYWAKSSVWMTKKSMYAQNSIPYLLPRHRVQDIDTEEDWIRAELMFEVNRLYESRGQS
ncbi:MAG: pseudaminic acid cytidylyltransferase [Candidatus Puniceispirillum sp. TMED52]|nr:MAG: pseudaminic acid cytidylyltransferase [Candidatus Puniceispirillum sp. TMED52]